jgi:hypothetical protein
VSRAPTARWASGSPDAKQLGKALEMFGTFTVIHLDPVLQRSFRHLNLSDPFG